MIFDLEFFIFEIRSRSPVFCNLSLGQCPFKSCLLTIRRVCPWEISQSQAADAKCTGANLVQQVQFSQESETHLFERTMDLIKINFKNKQYNKEFYLLASKYSNIFQMQITINPPFVPILAK